MTRRILVIDDDGPSRRLVRALFSSEGFEVIQAEDAASGLAAARAADVDVILLDVGLPDRSGLELLEDLAADAPARPVLMLTANHDIKTAVRAIRLGATDYLTKPIDHEELTIVVHRAVASREQARELADLRRQMGEGGGLVELMGPSKEVREVADQVAVVALSGFTVLVSGETGTGKELVAQAIHRQSDRRDQPFLAIDCGAIPESLLESELFGHEKGAFTGAEKRKAGRFQLAQGGTFLLDEVGNLPLNLQSKLLRVLESRELQPVGGTSASTLDVRFVAASNDDLHARVMEGAFRADLYFRLAQYTIALPPLRERPGDIEHLAQRFRAEVGVELRRPVQDFAPAALELLTAHRWPGNVRELRNVVRQAVLRTQDAVVGRDVVKTILGGQKRDAAPPRARSGQSLREVAEEAARGAERAAIADALRAARGNKAEAARALRTDYKTLHVKMKALGIRGRDYMPD